MATINATLPTLLDQIKRMDPDGSTARVVEALSKRNAFIRDAVWKEGNLPTGERVSTRTGLPSIGWRKFNEGVAAGKSKSDQFDEACGMMSAISKVDVQLAKLNGNEAAFRASEDVAFVQAMNIELERAMFYESTKTSPERLMGLAPRFDSISGHPYAAQIIDSSITDAGGSNNTSMWLVVWGLDTVYCIYPKGSMGGLEQKDMGEQLTKDSGGTNEFRAYVTDWTWKPGLVVKDARYVSRLANIDMTNIAATGDALITDMVKMVNAVQDLEAGRPVIYCNRQVLTYLQLQARDSVKNSTLTIDAVGGKPVTSFMGIPIQRTDAIHNIEATIS